MTYSCFILGSGPLSTTLQTQAQQRGLHNVRFGGEASVKDVPFVLARADICLATLIPGPYLEKIIPAKLFEYMACAKPTVAAIAGEGARVLSEADAGIVVAPGSPRAMADAIVRLADDPACRESMGARGRRFVEAGYSRTSTARRIERAMRELV